MEIIKASVKNIKDIANIEYNNGYPWSKYSLEEEIRFSELLLRNKEQTVFIAKKRNKLVGYVSIGVKNKVADIGLSVLKTHQGIGIGSLLFEYGIDFAKDKKCKKICIAAWENNKAISSYKKFGFVVKSVKTDFYENGDSLLYLELNLKKTR